MVNTNLIVVLSEGGCSIYHKDYVKIKGKYFHRNPYES
jgi:hypothetical protein